MPASPPNEIRLGPKEGSGVGATVEIYHRDIYAGALTFHDGGDWQATDSSQATQKSWETLFEPALALARAQYPAG